MRSNTKASGVSESLDTVTVLSVGNWKMVFLHSPRSTSMFISGRKRAITFMLVLFSFDILYTNGFSTIFRGKDLEERRDRKIREMKRKRKGKGKGKERISQRDRYD